MHPHSLYPYLTVNPPLSLLLVLLAHCVSRIPSLRALTHPLHSPPFLPLRAARCMKQIEYSMGDKKKCGGRCQLLGYMAVISAMCPTTTGRPPPPPPPPPLSERCTVRGSALLCSAGPHTLPPSCRGSMSSPLRCVTVRHVGIIIPTGFMPGDGAGL